MPALTTSRSYLPGDLIYSEEPFVEILPRQVKDEFCETCRCRPFNLRACKECLAVKYCGRPCQKKNWSIHRLECKYMKNLNEKKSKSDDLARLLGRVILKIKDKDWKTFKTSVLGIEVSFDDIDTHYKDMTENPHLNLLHKELKELTKEFIGAENMPSDIDFVKIAGKVIYNTYVNAEIGIPGVCFFIGLFMFEHECIPNSSFLVTRSKLKVWANKKIEKGTEKITVSYRRLFKRYSALYEEIRDVICTCSDCSLPYGESVLSKILDEKKAYSLMSMTEHTLRIGAALTAFGMESRIKSDVQDLLKKHAGVFGRTNILHLKLLAFRCFEIGGSAWELKSDLLTLEMIMSSVYGEYYIEMARIYETISLMYGFLGNFQLAVHYARKMNKVMQTT